MGINDLRLSPELMAALYPETLVESNMLPFLGKNLRSICFIVDCPEQDFLPEDQLMFLRKILSACKCSLDDIALVNAGRLLLHLDDLKKQLQPRILFLWGIRPESIGLEPDLPEFTISTVDDISVIPVLSPGLMSADSPEGVALKQRLWTCLKKLFNL
jgi:hypothetical protein